MFALIVSFNTKLWRDCCGELEKAEAMIGFDHAQKLMTLLADAEAVDTAAELIDLYSPTVTIDGGRISMPIGTRYRAYFEAVGAQLVRHHGLDWSSVKRVKLMEVAEC